VPGSGRPGRRCPRHPAAQPRRRTAAGGPPPRCVTRTRPGRTGRTTGPPPGRRWTGRNARRPCPLTGRFRPSGRAASPGRLRRRHPDAGPLGGQAQPQPVPTQLAHRCLLIVQLAGEPRAGNKTVVDRHHGDAAGGQRGEPPPRRRRSCRRYAIRPVDVDGDWRVVVRGR
jgi:hypothetical protein